MASKSSCANEQNTFKGLQMRTSAMLSLIILTTFQNSVVESSSSTVYCQLRSKPGPNHLRPWTILIQSVPRLRVPLDAVNPIEVGGTSLSLRRAWLIRFEFLTAAFESGLLNHALRGSHYAPLRDVPPTAVFGFNPGYSPLKVKAGQCYNLETLRKSLPKRFHSTTFTTVKP